MSSPPSPFLADDERASLPAKATWSPTGRLAAAIALGAVGLACGALLQSLFWLGLGWWLLLIAAVIAEARALRAARQLTLQRLLAPVISLGAANPVTLKLRNPEGYDYYCQLRDEPPLDFAVEGERPACHLPAVSECELTYHVTPPRRGDFAFGAINLRVTWGYRLVQLQLRFDTPQSVKVYPRLTDIQAAELALRKNRLLDIGVHLARLKGAGLEFESLRDYLPGDELRRIDWKATARHGEPFTREYEVERSQHVVICLDLGRTMASHLGLLSKVDHAVNAAALLAHVAAEMGDWVGLYAFAGEPMTYLPPRKHQFSRLLDSLYALQPELVESDYRRALLGASHRLRKRSLVVLFTDLPDPDSSARLIAHVRLLTRRHLVLCAALSDYELYELAAKSPGEPRELYQRTVATALLNDRERALSALRAAGAIALDATPANLSLAVLNRYLKIKMTSAL